MNKTSDGTYSDKENGKPKMDPNWDQQRDMTAKMGMLADLSTHRLEELPLEDNHDHPRHGGRGGRVGRAGRGGRGGHHLGMSRADFMSATSTGQPKATASNWKDALEGGEFDDEDAAAVASLDSLGGGRVYANREDEIQHVGRNVVMNMAMARRHRYPPQSPGLYPPQSPGREFYPHHLGRNTGNTSALGIVHDANMPIHKYPPNRIQPTRPATRPSHIIDAGSRLNMARSSAPNPQSNTNGIAPEKATLRAHLPVPDSVSSAKGPPAPSPQSNCNGIVPQKATLRAHLPVAASGGSGDSVGSGGSGNPVARPSRPNGTVFERYRQIAVFESTVNYIKGGGTDLKKAVLAIVLLSPKEAPNMGEYRLFIKKADEVKLEFMIMIPSMMGVRENNTQILLHIKESETRTTSQRLIFQLATHAREFLAIMEHLKNARSTPSQVVQTVTSAAPGTYKQSQTNGVNGVKVEASPIRVAAESDTAKTETAEILIVAPSAKDSDDRKAPVEQQEEPKTATPVATVEAPALDLLSDEFVVDSDHAPSIGSAITAVESSGAQLFDLAADESGSQNWQPHESNTHLLQDVKWSDHVSAAPEAETEAVPEAETGAIPEAEIEAIPEAEIEATPEDEARPTDVENECFQLKMDLEFMLEMALGLISKKEESQAEKDATVLLAKKTVVETVREKYLPQAWYYPTLTEQQKLQIIEEFSSPPHDKTTLPDETTAPDDTTGPTDDTTGRDNTTEPDETNSRRTRIEYSPSGLLVHKDNAVDPPDWLRHIPIPLKPGFRPKPDRSTPDARLTPREPARIISPSSSSSSEQAANKATATPATPRTDHGRAIPMQPFGRNPDRRPAAPPTPSASPTPSAFPCPVVDNLDQKFEKLTLTETPVATPSKSAAETQQQQPPSSDQPDEPSAEQSVESSAQQPVEPSVPQSSVEPSADQVVEPTGPQSGEPSAPQPIETQVPTAAIFIGRSNAAAAPNAGLGGSRWALETRRRRQPVKLVQPGNFTGVGSGAGRR